LKKHGELLSLKKLGGRAWLEKARCVTPWVTRELLSLKKLGGRAWLEKAWVRAPCVSRELLSLKKLGGRPWLEKARCVSPRDNWGTAELEKAQWGYSPGPS